MRKRNKWRTSSTNTSEQSVTKIEFASWYKILNYVSSLSPVRGIEMTSSVWSRVVCLFCKTISLGHFSTDRDLSSGLSVAVLFDEMKSCRGLESQHRWAILPLCVFVDALPPFCGVQPHSVMMPPPSPALPGINEQWAGPAHQNNEQFPSCSQTVKWSLMKGLNKVLHCALPKCSNNTGMSVISATALLDIPEPLGLFQDVSQTQQLKSHVSLTLNLH